MNDIFSTRRFFWLLRKFVMERAAIILGIVAIALTLTLLSYWMLQNTLGNGSLKAQGVAFVIGYFLGGSFIASIVFGYFGTNSGGISFLLLPASNFEKWLCGILIAGFFYTILFLGFFRLIDMFFVTNYHQNLNPSSPDYQAQYRAVELFSFTSDIAKDSFVEFANILGAMLVGSLYFNKNSYIKSALSICIGFVAIYFLNYFFASLFFSHIDEAIPFNHIYLKLNNEVGVIELPQTESRIINIALSYFLPIVLYLTAFIRLTEKEI